jgi:N-acetylneuraminic acid mutarotase
MRTPLRSLAVFVTLLCGCGEDSESGPSNGAAASGGSAATGGGSGGSSGSAGGSGGASGSSGSGGGAGNSGAGTGGAGGAPLEPAPGAYGNRADLLEPNSEMAVAEVSGKIYVLGGYPSSRVVQDTVEVYDPVTDAWDYSAFLPEPIHHPVAIGVDGKLYVLGGQLSNGDSARSFVFDPATGDPWVELDPMPTARGAGAAAVIGDVIYVVGGRPPAGNAFEAYDISDGAWATLPDLPQTFPERNHLAATAIGGKVYVAGGRHSGGSFSDPMTDSLDVYDPGARTWAPLEPLPRPRGGVNGIAAFGCFHVWGGEGTGTGEPNDVFPDHDVYDPRNDSWTSVAALPVPVHGVTGAAFVDGLIYIPGGGTRSGGTSGSTIFQVYRPDQRCD